MMRESMEEVKGGGTQKKEAIIRKGR